MSTPTDVLADQRDGDTRARTVGEDSYPQDSPGAQVPSGTHKEPVAGAPNFRSAA